MTRKNAKKLIALLVASALLAVGGLPAFAMETGQVGRRHVAATECYIDKTGLVRAWTGEVIALPGKAVDLAAGVNAAAANSVLNTAAVLADGSLYVWGRNLSGCLISGQPEKIEQPTKVKGLANVVSVSLGDGYGFIALTSDGAVYVKDTGIKAPTRAPLPERAAAVSRGGSCAAITLSGNLYTWEGAGAPAKVDHLPVVKAVSSGAAMTAAVTTDGALYTWGSDWGSNGFNQLGRGEAGMTDHTPGKVDLPPVSTAAVGRFFYAGAIDETGALWQWGSTGRDAKETITRETDSAIPAILAKDAPFAQLVFGSGQSAGVTEDGRLYTWGWNSAGELGSAADYYVARPALAAVNAARPAGVPFTGDLENLRNKTRAYDGRFADIAANKWYSAEVANAYEHGLVNGMSDNRFAPESPLRLSEAITMAVRIYERYTGAKESIPLGDPWYQPFLHRAIAYGICGVGQFEDCTRYATRAEMVAIFAHALPASELKATRDAAAPDVAAADPYASEIDMLYKTGVLHGDDEAGTFSPARNISRAEAAAICLRLVTQ